MADSRGTGRVLLLLPCMVLMMAGCGDRAAEDKVPPVPPQLVAHDELPFGDRASSRITRASKDVRDRLEPEWGHLESRIYSLPSGERDAVLRQVGTGLPDGWKPVPLSPDLPKEQGLLRAFAKGKRLYALLFVDMGADGLAVVLFRTGDKAGQVSAAPSFGPLPKRA